MSKTSYMTSPYPNIYQYSQNDYGVMLAYVKQDHARGALQVLRLWMPYDKLDKTGNEEQSNRSKNLIMSLQNSTQQNINGDTTLDNESATSSIT